VLSEVTAFRILVGGVALVDAVERSGLVYKPAEKSSFDPDAQFCCLPIHDTARLTQLLR
jgi:hypothetical protein